MSDLTKHHDPRVAAMYKRMASGGFSALIAKKTEPSASFRRHFKPRTASAAATRQPDASPPARKPAKAATTSGLSSFGHLLRGDHARAAEVAAIEVAAAASRADAAHVATLDATITDAIAFVEGKPRSAASAPTQALDPVLAEAIALVNSTRR